MAFAIVFYYTLSEELNTMLKNLFRPKWQHENLEIRKAAIAKLGTDEINILKEIAFNDRDGSLRQLAISKIEDLSFLQSLIAETISENDREFALKCWVNVLTQTDQLSPMEIENFILDCQNEKLLAGIISYCEKSDLKELALSGIKSEEQLLSLMHNTKTGRVWQAIIEKLSSEDAIKKALAIVNGRDKKSQQTIKNKLDAIKAHQLIATNNEKTTDALYNKLDHLFHTEFNPLYEGILLTAKQQWQTLANEISSEKAQKISSLITQCEQRLANDRQKKESIALETTQYAEDIATQNNLLHQLIDLKLQTLTNEAGIESLTQEKNTLVKHWQAIKLKGDAKQQLTFNQLVSDINNLLEAHSIISNKHLQQKLSDVDISSLGLADINESIEDLNRITDLLKKSGIEKNAEFLKEIEIMLDKAMEYRKDFSQKNKNLLKHIEVELVNIENLIEKKELTLAQNQFSHTRNSLSLLPENEKYKYNNAVQRIFNALKTLEDWKNFANDEKRMELCLRMNKMINNDINALEKSEIIHTLQQEWKALGHCQNKKLWDEFKSYADEAYLPCQQYFNEQKKIRAFNAEQKKIICNQIETFIETQNWDVVDWKSLDKIYKALQDEWKKYTPVERQDHQTLQNRFFKSTDLLKEKINHERKNNTLKLTNLITQAENLMAATDAQQAIEEYTKLQNEWKTVGITFQKQQHEQWQSFKKAGDALYEKRQNARKEADHERQENLDKAISLSNEIIALSLLPDNELANSRPVFEKLKTAFKELGSLPKDNFKNSLQNFNNACNTYENNFKNINKRQWLKQFEKLVSLGNSWLTQDISDEDILRNLPNTGLPEKWLARLQQRFQLQTLASDEEYARTLCIEIELLAGLETPPEDSTLKMQWQLSKLAKNFGQLQSQSENEKIEDLYLRWFSQKCWNESSCKQLQNRFLNAGSILLGNQPQI